MIDAAAFDDLDDALWVKRLAQVTCDGILDRAKLARELEEHGTAPFDRDHLDGQPLLRRHDSLAGPTWFVLERDHLWWVAVGSSPATVDTELCRARQARARRTGKLDTSLEILLGRLYRLQTECGGCRHYLG